MVLRDRSILLSEVKGENASLLGSNRYFVRKEPEIICRKEPGPNFMKLHENIRETFSKLASDSFFFK
jgi:hypothetical protein